MSKNERIVAIEEHFVSPMMAKKFSGHHKLTPFMHSTRRLEDLGDARIREMDEAGIDVQVISHMQPGPQVFEPDMSVTLARQANNVRSEAELVAWLNDIGTVPDGTTSLDQVNQKWLRMVLDDWPGIIEQVKAFLDKMPA